MGGLLALHGCPCHHGRMTLKKIIDAAREWVALETRQRKDFGVQRPLPVGIKALHDELVALMSLVDGGAEGTVTSRARIATGAAFGEESPEVQDEYGEDENTSETGVPVVVEGGRLTGLTLPEAIDTIMRSRDPIPTADLLVELDRGGKGTARKRLENTLHRLTREKRLARVRPGVYTRGTSPSSQHEPV